MDNGMQATKLSAVGMTSGRRKGAGARGRERRGKEREYRYNCRGRSILYIIFSSVHHATHY